MTHFSLKDTDRAEILKDLKKGIPRKRIMMKYNLTIKQVEYIVSKNKKL